MLGKLKKHDKCYSLFVKDVEMAIYDIERTERPLYSLSKENCDEIFGVVDVEKLSKEYVNSHQSDDFKYTTEEYYNAQIDFKEGFNKAIELNKDKLFTEQQVRTAIEIAWRNEDSNKIDIIKTIQEATEIDVEIITRPYTDVNEGFVLESLREPKLDENGCLIMKKL